MTALTLPAWPEEDASLRPVPWGGWPGSRGGSTASTLASVAALLGAVAVSLWIAGLQLHHAYAAATACHPASRGATAPGAKLTKFVSVRCPSTGRNPRPGANSTGASARAHLRRRKPGRGGLSAARVTRAVHG
jgi:hypothetical protein